MGKLGGDAVNDTVFCAQGGTMLDKVANGPAFKAKYKARFKLDADAYAASYYDQVMFMANAMQKANSTQPAKVGAQMLQSSHQGVAGHLRLRRQGQPQAGAHHGADLPQRGARAFGKLLTPFSALTPETTP